MRAYSSIALFPILAGLGGVVANTAPSNYASSLSTASVSASDSAAGTTSQAGVSTGSVAPAVTSSSSASTKSCKASGAASSLSASSGDGYISSIGVEGATPAVTGSTSVSASASAAGGLTAATDLANAVTTSAIGIAAAGTTTGNAATSTSTGSTSGGSGSLTLRAPSSSCTCGYTISSLNDQYYPYALSVDFSSMGDKTFSGAYDLIDQGFIINTASHVGGPASDDPDAAQCWGDASNLQIKDGSLVLTVPTQTLSSKMKCAELSHNVSTTGGIFQFEAELSNTPGTCQAFWLNHTDPTQYADEYDIEILGGTITEANSAGTGPGMYYSNWPADGNPNDPNALKSNDTLVPFPSGIDPTTSFNNYTIAWLSDSSTRYFNGAAENSPTTNLAEHPMNATINHWTNGAAGWSAGPPTQDTSIKVKSVLFYYKTADQDGVLNGCTTDQACKV